MNVSNASPNKDVLIYWANNFDVRTLGRVTRVCKHWFRIMSSHPRWQHFFLRDFEAHVSVIPREKDGEKLDWRKHYNEQANSAYNLIARLVNDQWKANKLSTWGTCLRQDSDLMS